jgi:hypothetical protein
MSATIIDDRPVWGRILWTGKAGLRVVVSPYPRTERFGEGELEEAEEAHDFIAVSAGCGISVV